MLRQNVHLSPIPEAIIRVYRRIFRKIMLVFIDEAGDTDRKIEGGSSRFFVISLVLFDEEANACDQRISLLRRELKFSENYEFHFTENSKRIRIEFLKAIQPYNFMYFAVALNKDDQKLWGPGFSTKESFYKYTCQMVFTNAMPYLDEAIVILDKSGNPEFRSRLAKYLKKRLNKDNQRIIKKIKQQKSSSNNLLQLADYISGIINRKSLDKKDWHEYYKYIAPREIWVQVWPK